jgi:gag-polypeptide of LTR copia-type
MKEKEVLKEYFSKVIELVNQIKSLGENLSDKVVCEKNFISFSSKYNNIAIIIEEINDISTLSVQDLMGSLEMHEQRMNRNDEQSLESAFQTKVNVKEPRNQNASSGNTSRGGHGGGRSRGNYGRGGDRDNNQGNEVKTCHYCKMSGPIEKFCRNKEKPQCHHCKKFGHIEKFCRLKNGEQSNYAEEKK